MDNNDERDYAEESANRRLWEEVDDLDIGGMPPSFGGNADKLPEWDGEEMSVFPDIVRTVHETPLPIGYGDSWDGSATNKSNDFFIGHSGHVTILWHVVNNPYEKYDSKLSYHMSALDGSALYVWCSLHFTYPDAYASISRIQDLLYQIEARSSVHHL